MIKMTERVYSKAFPDFDREVVAVDIFSVHDQEKIILTFEAKNSAWRQGVRLSCDDGLAVNRRHGASMLIWCEAIPQQVPIQCFTTNGLLVVYNIWDRGRGMDSMAHTSGMLLEDVAHGRRYRCNDIGLETDFNKLIFRIERIRGEGAV